MISSFRLSYMPSPPTVQRVFVCFPPFCSPVLGHPNNWMEYKSWIACNSAALKARTAGNWDSSVAIVSRLRNGQPRICGSIPGRRKKCFSFPKLQDRLWFSPALPLMDVRVSLPGGKAARTWRWPHLSMYWGDRNPWSSVSTPPHNFTAYTETAVLLHRKTIAFSHENQAKLKYGQIIELFNAELYSSYGRLWSRFISCETRKSGTIL